MSTERLQEFTYIPYVFIWCLLVIVSIVTIGIASEMLSGIQRASGMCGKEMSGGIIPISSLNTDTYIEGHFVLGFGDVSTERVYIAYTGNDITGYTLVKRPMSESILFEDTNNNPYIEEVSIFVCYSTGYDLAKKYKFHVPKGTITTEYKV